MPGTETARRVRMVAISGTAVPHQVALCKAMQRYVDAEFWFYNNVGKIFAWRAVPLDAHCRIIAPVWFKGGRTRYFTLAHLGMLARYAPDVVMVGGFSVPANAIAYLWARRHAKKTIVFTERSRDRHGRLRGYGLVWRFLRWLYRDVDMIIVSSSDIVPQFAQEFRFGDRVVVGQYGNTIDGYLSHPVRRMRPDLQFIFPNRLTEIYNPLCAIRIFRKVLAFLPGAGLAMNGVGELRGECEKLIRSLGLTQQVRFLDHLANWNDLDAVYRNADIMIFPATFSNGNFTITDAMASGMGIVISNRVLGHQEEFEDNVTGFICNPDEDEFVTAIRRFLADESLFAKFAATCRERVRRFGIPATAEILNTHVQNVMKGVKQA